MQLSPSFILLSSPQRSNLLGGEVFAFWTNGCLPRFLRSFRDSADSIRWDLMLQHQHQFAELGRKKLEQAIQQLQEQLQLNVIQQTHLLQTADKKKASAPLQQLALQQQRLVQQLQITQSQYLLQQGLGLQGHNSSSGITLDKTMLLISHSRRREFARVISSYEKRKKLVNAHGRNSRGRLLQQATPWVEQQPLTNVPILISPSDPPLRFLIFHFTLGETFRVEVFRLRWASFPPCFPF